VHGGIASGSGRAIPTEVGNTGGNFVVGLLQSGHPHGGGEHSRFLKGSPW
jgi:hypothetical protein